MTGWRLALLTLMFLAAPLRIPAQNSPPKSGPIGLPTLDETIAFMNRSVAPEDGYVTTANECELYFTRNRLYTIAFPVGRHVRAMDSLGVQHLGFDWMVVKESPRIIRFSLGTINPDSIKSKPVPSTQFIQERDVDEHPDALKRPDLMAVTFTTSDSEKTIEVGQFHDGASSPVFDQKLAMELLVFESKDRAERFVTAFVHAVQSCGGKGSAFPPTPSGP